MSDRFIRTIFLFVLLPIILIVLVGGAMAATGARIYVALGPASIPIALFLLGQAMRRHRRQCDLAALAHVEHAVRLNLPLQTMLDAAAKTETGKLRTRLIGLAHDIEAGDALGLSIGYRLRSLPPRTVTRIEAAERAGCLLPQLTSVLEEERKAFQQEMAREPVTLIYPIIVLSGLLAVIGAAGLFIAPKFEKIFEDFEITLPVITQQVLSLSPLVGPPLLVLGAAMILGVSAIGVVQIAGGEFSHTGLRHLLEHLAWRLPILHGIQRNRGLADVFATLADLLETGHPLPRALARVDDLAVNPVLRSRVAQWRNLVERGVAVDSAARDAKLPPLVVGLLRTGQAAGNLPEVCRFLVRHYAGRFSRLATVVRGAVVPAVVVGLALLVALVIVAMFLPLIKLIESVASQALIN